MQKKLAQLADYKKNSEVYNVIFGVQLGVYMCYLKYITLNIIYLH